jgi:dihydrofolate reductase
MIISLIVAMDENRAIGIQNQLPWHLPNDLRRFKTLTMGHHLIMGRKTYESIGQPLPGRIMIIITRQHDYQPYGCLVANSLRQAINLAAARQETEVFIVGGGQIFAQCIDLADRIYLTLVHTRVTADVYFPEFDRNNWDEVESIHHPADVQHPIPFTFITLEKKVRHL